jgi:hypothetical protein
MDTSCLSKVASLHFGKPIREDYAEVFFPAEKKFTTEAGCLPDVTERLRDVKKPGTRPGFSQRRPPLTGRR